MLRRIFLAIVFVICFGLVFSFNPVSVDADKGNDKEKSEKYRKEKAKKDDDDDDDDDKKKKDKKAKKDKKSKEDDDDDDRKVTLCHYPSGDTDKGQTISVGKGAVDAHIKHGDTVGACVGDEGKIKGRERSSDEAEGEKKGKKFWEFWKKDSEE